MRAEWSSDDARWTVDAERTDTGETVQLTCSFLFTCTGYYRYDEGYTPEFAGIERFQGQIVHPQHWPEDLDYAGKRVVVIGSGATAVTLVPAMADARRARDDAAALADLHRRRCPARTRSPSCCARVLPTRSPTRRALEERAADAGELLPAQPPRAEGSSSACSARASSDSCPPGYDVDTHFTPRYDPWDQRLCLVPDGDLFEAIATGERVGRHRPDRDLHRDGHAARVRRGARGRHRRHRDRAEPAAARRHRARRRRRATSTSPKTVGYKGMMLSGVPNLAFALGYTNASWTLKCDLDLRVRLPAAQPHGRARLRPVHAAAPGSVGARSSRSSTSRRATCCASIDKFPKQGSTAAVAAAPELPARHPDAQARRPRGRGHRVLARDASPTRRTDSRPSAGRSRGSAPIRIRCGWSPTLMRRTSRSRR